MAAVLRALRHRPKGPLRVLDLGTGPGALAVRILRQFPQSTVVGLDADPALLEVGRRALARFRGRVTWVLADLRTEEWASSLRPGKFHAVVSSLALHWLEKSELRRVYRDSRELLRPGGILVEADFLPHEELEARPRSRTRGPARNSRPPSSKTAREFRTRWAAWWRKLEEDPALQSALESRRVLIPGEIPPRRTWGPEVPASVEFHLRAVRRAGFSSASVVWEERGMRAIVATT